MRFQGEQRLRGFELEGIAFAGQLLSRPLARRVLELAELGDYGLALPFEIAPLESGVFLCCSSALRGFGPGTAEHLPDEDRAQHQPPGQDEQGRGPVDARRGVHRGSVRGGKPPGQP